MLLGICEEAGELCHAQLKKEQGIRGTIEQHDAAMKDAVGDIMIYAINYLSGIDAQISPINPREDVEPFDDDKRIRDCIFTIFNIVGRIVGDVTKENSRLVHQLAGQLNYFCAVKEWNLEEIIRETWREVGQRDWKQFPETGAPPKESLESAPELPAQESTEIDSAKSVVDDLSQKLPENAS